MLLQAFQGPLHGAALHLSPAPPALQTPPRIAPPASCAAVKAAGKWRQEGKMYEVQDGDIIHW